MFITRKNCCGILELDGLREYRTAEDVLQDFVRETVIPDEHGHILQRNPGAFVLFSEARSGKYALKLKEVILKERLGAVFVSPSRRNPNSLNMIRVYLWTIDQARLKKYAKKIQAKDTAERAEEQAELRAINVGHLQRG